MKCLQVTCPHRRLARRVAGDMPLSYVFILLVRSGHIFAALRVVLRSMFRYNTLVAALMGFGFKSADTGHSPLHVTSSRICLEGKVQPTLFQGKAPHDFHGKGPLGPAGCCLRAATATIIAVVARLLRAAARLLALACCSFCLTWLWFALRRLRWPAYEQAPSFLPSARLSRTLVPRASQSTQVSYQSPTWLDCMYCTVANGLAHEQGIIDNVLCKFDRA
jgi:hypothetical protein